MSEIYLSDDANESPGRRIQATLTDATAQPWIILDTLKPGETVSVGLVIGTGEGHIVYTAEDISSITNGTADGVIWSKGSVTTTTYGYFPSGITAIKFVWTSGTIKGVAAR